LKTQKLFFVVLVIFILTVSYANVFAAEVVLKFGSPGAPTKTYGYAIEKLSKLAEEKSEGRLKVEIFHGGQLGNERDLIEGVKMGTVDMCLTGASTLGVWDADFFILGMAFIWKDADHMLKVVRGPIGQRMVDKLLKETGIMIVDMGWNEGSRQLDTNKPIRTPDDIVGLKLRVPEVPIYLSNMRAMGASAIAMNPGETFTSIQTGVIDGQDNSLDSIYANKMYEVTKYANITSHVTQNQAICMNPKRFNEMPEDLQKILVEATNEAGNWMNEEKVTALSRFKKLLADEGMTIVDDVDREAFRKKCEGPVLEEWKDKWTPGLYEEIVEAGK